MRVSPIATYAMAVLMVTFIMGGGVATGKTPRWLHDLLAIAKLLTVLDISESETQAIASFSPA